MQRIVSRREEREKPQNEDAMEEEKENFQIETNTISQNEITKRFEENNENENKNQNEKENVQEIENDKMVLEKMEVVKEVSFQSKEKIEVTMF